VGARELVSVTNTNTRPKAGDHLKNQFSIVTKVRCKTYLSIGFTCPLHPFTFIFMSIERLPVTCRKIMSMYSILLFLAMFTASANDAVVPDTTSPAVEVAVSETPPNLFLSTDWGQNWTGFVDGLPDGTNPRTILEHEGKLLLATSGKGVFVLPAGKSTWEARNQGLPVEVFATSLAAHEKTLVLGTYDKGVYVSRDGGLHWRRPIFNIKGGSVRALLFHEGQLIAGTDSGIYRSLDGGESWRRSGPITQINGLVLHNGQLFAARQNGMGVLNDDVATWSSVYTDRTITQLTSQGDYLYARSIGGSIIRSTDGKVWEKQIFTVPAPGNNSLPEALWNGYSPDLPSELPVSSIIETSRGWIAGLQSGC
jgi:hypothetical protein